MKQMKTIFTVVFSMLGLMFSKIESVFFKRNALMSKNAVDLLNDPKNRDKFIEFTTGINSEGKRKENSKKTETFIKENGDTVTLIKST